MRSIEDIESFVDSLPAPCVAPRVTKIRRRKPFWKTLILVGVSVCVLLVACLVVTGVLQFLVVLSGSMQPTFHAGDVIVTMDAPADSLKVRDIITFRSPDHPKNLMTHRIVQILNASHGLMFQTQGDANENPDQSMVSSELVVGRMVCVIPYVGYLASLSHSLFGFLLLVLAPGIVVICGEVVSIVKRVKGR